MKPTQCPAQEKKMRQEKWKKKGGEKAESKSQDCLSLLNPNLEILFFAHARTSQANILHLDQMAAKGMTSKWLCVSFSSS